jgi:hypothetical protein
MGEQLIMKPAKNTVSNARDNFIEIITLVISQLTALAFLHGKKSFEDING